MSNEHNNNEWMDMVEMYVLGGLDREEQERFEAYMRQSEQCRLAVEELREVVGFLPLVTESIVPPKGMKNRVLDRVFAETKSGSEHEASAFGLPFESVAPTTITLPTGELDTPQQPASNVTPLPQRRNEPATEVTEKRTSRGAIWRITTAVAVAAAILIGVYAGNLRGQLDNMQQQLAMNSSQIGSLQQQIVAASMPSQGLRVNEAVKLSPAAKDIVAQGLATIVIDDKGTHLLVQADNLPKLEGTQAFQVWLIKGNIKQSAGTFLTRGGNGAMYYTFKPEDYDTIAITLEPDGTGDQPRGPVILAANIADQG
ncbi:anti-sigma factor domain-containing protein [Paenibacillus sp. WLX2291]|uniref:anti-sigma factor domain-containing protein n=1 Tax=Paenibacillus sp. WLX2291 TaxID=3296934 RepID=UPI0039842B65